MTHGDTREGKWRRNWRMQWVASTLHTTSEHVVSSITTADAHTSAASSRLNWRPRRFKVTRPFRRKTKSGFSACAITFQLAFTEQIGGFFAWYINEIRSQRHSVSRDSSVSIVTKLFTENEDSLRAYNDQPPVLIQSHINPAHALSVHSFKARCKIIFSCTSYIFQMDSFLINRLHGHDP